jgi:hypothetical protein
MPAIHTPRHRDETTVHVGFTLYRHADYRWIVSDWARLRRFLTSVRLVLGGYGTHTLYSSIGEAHCPRVRPGDVPASSPQCAGLRLILARSASRRLYGCALCRIMIRGSESQRNAQQTKTIESAAYLLPPLSPSAISVAQCPAVSHGKRILDNERVASAPCRMRDFAGPSDNTKRSCPALRRSDNVGFDVGC